MKKMLLLLSVLIVAPAWAEAPAQTATTGNAVVIELKGQARSVSALIADLKKDEVYQAAACSTGKKSGKTTKITCSKTDGALLTFLANNAPAEVRWSISAAPAGWVPQPPGCPPPAGCSMMNCPPPGGTYRCCNNNTRMPC